MRTIYTFQKKPSVIAAASVAGKLEKSGPLGSFFDIVADGDDKFEMQTWEKAESEMVRMASEIALKKAKLGKNDIDLVFAGDLMNQCTASSFAFCDKEIPYIGLYGACSTFALGLGMAALSVESGLAETALASASSHFCSAERQYRFPLEYGNQRPPTAQNTVTAAGSAVVSGKSKGGFYVNEFLVGIMRDFHIKDVNNMGAAMAPAAADTLLRYLALSGLAPDSFDLILTGDLGMEGKNILLDLFAAKGVSLGANYNDCGVMIYDLEKQDVHAGGSGCGCSAAVFCGFVAEQFHTNKVKDVLLIGTGALLNPATVLQKESIPGVAHLIRITREE